MLRKVLGLVVDDCSQGKSFRVIWVNGEQRSQDLRSCRVIMVPIMSDRISEEDLCLEIGILLFDLGISRDLVKESVIEPEAVGQQRGVGGTRHSVDKVTFIKEF